ncbi:MAG: YbhB/YbcL family Raf kinase inhibitor-like protein [Candidatus Zambryskibacteria bacterium CG_4_9_14_3_um_filter_42_9]|uniref:YbhB/YbcL family Raf kinase inhibitor-like protein n=1 Tax=Candidatus Zambryskibacteria bacterium CG22_combo_CG10-13_8_21_14_all_42_17 TaxID=1975118 RepID=A0A2H0BE04_9BACT|nr:MAG: YbhB/YbcL family Raf kinase inhibitor-like protein [Candidatus Zambryskibacteria bacterium CG22_combo_CG10-13_8_21_14_all_42_17]PJA37028.1 MAG: YbhB/YbcL family Raf kinase inhibitor-like protein [Candidatus Zambryskibacteria bacterium CG_4_9_14_3_um_filter_42_9]
MKLESPAFADGEFIGSKYTCDEINISPPLKISGVPIEAKSLVLIMDDPDVPRVLRPDGVFDHWVVYNIPSTTTNFLEGKFEGVVGNNGKGEAKYTGPCPPTQYQPTTHRYFFRLYATDIPTLNFIKVPTKQEVLTAIEGHIIDEIELMGRYDRLKTIQEND